MMNNNQKSNYIILKYNQDGYNIIIHTDTQKQKLSPEKAKIMRKVLHKYKPYQINEDTYLYREVYSIIFSYKRELNKSKRKINRQKSANLTLCVALTASLAVGGYFVYNYLAKEKDKPNSTSEETNNDLPEIDEKSKKILEEAEQITNEVIEETEIKTSLINQNPNIQEEKENKIKEFSLNDEYVEAYYYDNEPGDQKSFEIASKYNNIYLKYERIYGVDAELQNAIAAQESSGDPNQTNNYAFGLMGIEYTRDKDTITAYNFETNQYEKIIVDLERAKKDIDYCIMIRAANFQEFFNTVYNSKLIPSNEILLYTLQRDNMGAKRMQDMISTGEHWMEARKKEIKGDSNYPENVLSRLENETVITLRKPDGSYFNTTITNTYTKENTSNKVQK